MRNTFFSLLLILNHLLQTGVIQIRIHFLPSCNNRNSPLFFLRMHDDRSFCIFDYNVSIRSDVNSRNQFLIIFFRIDHQTDLSPILQNTLIYIIDFPICIFFHINAILCRALSEQLWTYNLYILDTLWKLSLFVFQVQIRDKTGLCVYKFPI